MAEGGESDGLAQLHAKYADDSDDCSIEPYHEAKRAPVLTDLQTSSDPSSSKWQQQQQQSPERLAEPPREERWSDYDEEEFASSDEEDDDEVYAALEWADDREGWFAALVPSVAFPVLGAAAAAATCSSNTQQPRMMLVCTCS